MRYNWQQRDWPNFLFKLDGIEDTLSLFREKIGHNCGVLKALSIEAQQETLLEMMVSEAIKTSEIEGEFLSREDVMSSIKNNLGINKVIEVVKDKRANGVADLMIAVRNSYEAPLDEKTLFEWHSMLMEGNKKINAGQWRTDKAPMQVISGPAGKETIHFEAPPSDKIEEEMDRFIKWFNNTAPGGSSEIKKAPVRSAIAHLYFESIHPFEDGNGRIGRAIAEKVLFQSLKNPILLSISKTIESNKKAYYKALMNAQRSNEITPWINYFVQVIFDAQIEAEAQVNFTLKKTKFFDAFAKQLNERQAKVLRRMLKEGPEGFEGGISAKKYMAIAKTSKATATRDLQDLVAKKILLPIGGGRSTSYKPNF